MTSSIDPRVARYVNDNLADYLIPVNADIQQLDVILVPEEDNFVNPAGVKGIGELGNVGTAAAVANAVYHATGVRVRQLPNTVGKTPDSLIRRLSPGFSRRASDRRQTADIACAYRFRLRCGGCTTGEWSQPFARRWVKTAHVRESC